MGFFKESMGSYEISIRILWEFYSDSNGFYRSSIRLLKDFYRESIRNSIRILKGFRVSLQDFFKDSKKKSKRGAVEIQRGSK